MTETKQWMGLHNPERHGQEGQGRARLWCECGSWCSEDALCDCCELVELRAEVERLERAEAAIARVRELCDDERFSQCSCGRCPIQVDARDILRALDSTAVPNE